MAVIRFLAIILTSAVTLVSIVPAVIAAESTQTQPNVIFVLADDLGWSELGCYGNGFNETPHLDRLAAGGMRFTQAYAAAPVCSPYRAAFLTGQHPARVGILDYLRPNSANALSTDHVTLPEMFRSNGYATGMVGKWHLTGYAYHQAEHEIRPTDHGFDWNVGSEVKGVGNGANFWPYVFRDQDIRWLDFSEQRLGKDEFLVDRMNFEAVEFIERHQKRPFFLFLSHYAPHTIMNGRPDLVDKYRQKHPPGNSTRERCYLCQDNGHVGDSLHHWAQDHNPHLAAMLESIDHGIGLIDAKLHELGLAENTIFVFSSDNGGETNVTSNAPLRGGKSQLYEGGIRVPMIVRWPGQVPAGSSCHEPTMNVDFYPTLLDAAGIEPDTKQTLDGISTLPTWKDARQSTGRDALYWHYPLDRPHFLGGKSSAAVRKGNWKLIEYFDTGKTELYSLDDDLSESTDLSAENPERVTALKSQLATWRRHVDARVPSPPLLTESRNLYFADHFSPGQVSNRWFFTGDWSAENGVLQRRETAKDNGRIFLRNPEYKDVIIRFDFQFQNASELRLVTGGGGFYNAGIHILRDHFYIHTALDKSGPYFPYRHGECAYEFDPDRWYTMTVEFIGDQLVAHVDREHLAYAKHPVLDKQRLYFAFQVDRSSAAFDNVQILKAARHREQAENLDHIEECSGKYPVEKTVAEAFESQKRNAHETFYQQHSAYRALVKRIDDLDLRNKRLYPNVFRSHKEFQKEIAAERKKLHAEDPDYKETLFATFRADRAIDDYLIAQQPGVRDLPDSQRKREFERLRDRHRSDAEYKRLVALRDAAQQLLENRYPQLFRTNEDITRFRREQRSGLKGDPDFKRAIDERAAAWRAQQDYLFQHDSRLAELQKLLDEDSQ